MDTKLKTILIILKTDFMNTTIKNRENEAKKTLAKLLETWNTNDLMEWLHGECKEQDERDSILETAINIATRSGYIIIRNPSLCDRDKIEALLDNLYPNINEQQMYLIAC